MKSTWKSKLTSGLFVLPYFCCYVLFLLFPIFYGLYISLHNFDLLSPVHVYVGLKNYIDMFTPGQYLHDTFFQGLWATLQFVVYSVPCLVVIGLLFALLLNALPGRVRGFFRTVYFMPYAISASVMATIWLWMFDTNSGLINLTLNKFFSAMPIPWLTDLPWAWVSLVAATIWWTIGFNMIIFVNALNQVPEDQYEAAALDGASAWDRLRFITLPAIKPVMLFIMITSTIASFNIYAQPYLLTRGGPGTATRVLLINVLDEAFGRRQIGSASAMAIVMALIMMVISAVQYRVSYGKKEG